MAVPAPGQARPGRGDLLVMRWCAERRAGRRAARSGALVSDEGIMLRWPSGSAG